MGVALSTTRRAAGLFHGHRRAASRILLLTLPIASINAVEPLVLKSIFDDLSGGGTWRVLGRALAVLAVLGLAREGLGALANWLDWRLALLVVALAPLPPLIAARAAPEQKARERRLLDRWAKIYSRFNEVLSGIVVVKSFTREDEEKQRFIEDVAAANQIVVSGVRFDAQVTARQNLAVTLARLFSLALGGALVMRGEITIGTLVAFVGYMGGVFGPVQGLSGVYRTLHTASVSLDTITSILEEQEHLGDAPDARELGPVSGEVAFDILGA